MASFDSCATFMLRHNKKFPYSNNQNICCMLQALYKFSYYDFQTWSILKTSGLRKDQIILPICKHSKNGKI